MIPQFHDVRIGALFVIASSSGTNKTFKHTGKEALDLYAKSGIVYCTYDAKRNTNITAAISDKGQITVSPHQAPYFAWVASNGNKKRTVVQ